jgi:crotonobetainyl-CoA:carnitine CoA-transferase CaiB-like acyl-CoA transferase
MALTGTRATPLGPPSALVPGLDELGARFSSLDPLSLLGERAAFMELSRAGSISCSGGCHLMQTRDGWIAVSLVRPEDAETVPAWLELSDAPPSDVSPALWSLVAEQVAERKCDELIERAALLNLPVGALGVVPDRDGVVPTRLGDAPALRVSDAVVIDLTSLWAGPLCGDLLAREGALVIKIESTARPDGTRRGPQGFFDLLNGGKRSVALDFRSREGIDLLRTLITASDIVLEGSRPRALEQLGINAADVVAAGGPQVWVSITGYGRDDDNGLRVAFGDDAAVAGGLVGYEGNTPMFCGDAIADPLTGLTAANACISALETGGRWLLDVAMAAVAATYASPTLPSPSNVTPCPPRARSALATAPALGADTDRVIREFRLRS